MPPLTEKDGIEKSHVVSVHRSTLEPEVPERELSHSCYDHKADSEKGNSVVATRGVTPVSARIPVYLLSQRARSPARAGTFRTMSPSELLRAPFKFYRLSLGRILSRKHELAVCELTPECSVFSQFSTRVSLFPR